MIVKSVAFALFSLLLMTNLGYGRPVAENTDMVSDGLITTNQTISTSRFMALEATVTCEPPYGFLPCTTNLWGLLFLIVMYEYLLFLGEGLVNQGSELFFRIVGPTIIGSGAFHILGTIPQVSVVLVSGLSGSFEAAKMQSVMGMDVLVGSTAMSLTLVWASCVAFGSTDLSPGFGVTTDGRTRYTARIMFLSIIPFTILQLAKIIGSSSVTRVIILIALLITLTFLISYLIFQAFQPWVQDMRFEYVTQKFVQDKLLKLLSTNGKPNLPLIKEVFHEIDKNKNGYISSSELRVLILGIQLEDDGILVSDDYVEKVMEAFDRSGNDQIDENEFYEGISKFLSDAKNPFISNEPFHTSNAGSSVKTPEEEQLLVARSARRRKRQGADNSWLNYLTAAFLVIFGTAMLVLLARPLINTVGDFATAANIPFFFVPYVAIPLAMGYRQTMRAITSARQQTQNSISLTLTQLYGGVFMSNMIGLTVFLSLVYFRNLPWDVSAEALVVFILITVMGVATSTSTKFPFWTSILAYILYALSLLLLYVLTSVLGWS